MEIPELIDIVYNQILDKYREKIEKEDNCIIMKDAGEEKDALLKLLNDEQKKLLNRYSTALENKFEYLNYQLNTFLLYIGIKYGMELQKAFNDE